MTRKRNVTNAEIESKLRSAGDYLGYVLNHHGDAIAATTGTAPNVERYNDAYRLLYRDLTTFVGTARTLWNYLNQATDATGHRPWLDARLFSNVICRFHREVANQDLHDHDIVLAIDQKVLVEGTVLAPMPPSRVPVKVPLQITGLDGITFYYNPNELESAAQEAYQRVLLVHGRQSATILATRYLGELQSVVKSGLRGGRF